LNSEKILNSIFVLAIVALVAMNGILIYKIDTGSKQPSTYTPTQGYPKAENTIVVSGTGATHARPDVALVNLGVRTQCGNAEDTLQENAKRMNAVMEALKANGIAADEIKTIGYRFEPLMKYEEKTTPTIAGYVAENTVQATLKDVTKVGRIIDTAVSAGANQVRSIQFTISTGRVSELRKQAIAVAIQDAKQKAETISKNMGVELIGPTAISLTPGYEPRPLVSELKAGGTPIEPGELEVSLSVQITYAFRKP
jgi:uncharacterized protein YggE